METLASRMADLSTQNASTKNASMKDASTKNASIVDPDKIKTGLVHLDKLMPHLANFLKDVGIEVSQEQIDQLTASIFEDKEKFGLFQQFVLLSDVPKIPVPKIKNSPAKNQKKLMDKYRKSLEKDAQFDIVRVAELLSWCMDSIETVRQGEHLVLSKLVSDADTKDYLMVERANELCKLLQANDNKSLRIVNELGRTVSFFFVSTSLTWQEIDDNGGFIWSLSKLQKAKAVFEFLETYPRFLETALTYTKLTSNKGMEKLDKFIKTQSNDVQLYWSSTDL